MEKVIRIILKFSILALISCVPENECPNNWVGTKDTSWIFERKWHGANNDQTGTVTNGLHNDSIGIFIIKNDSVSGFIHVFNCRTDTCLKSEQMDFIYRDVNAPIYDPYYWFVNRTLITFETWDITIATTERFAYKWFDPNVCTSNYAITDKVFADTSGGALRIFQ